MTEPRPVYEVVVDEVALPTAADYADLISQLLREIPDLMFLFQLWRIVAAAHGMVQRGDDDGEWLIWYVTTAVQDVADDAGRWARVKE